MERRTVWQYINKVYANDLTTTSGGNLSVRAKDGTVWITPSGKDKGTLSIEDICSVSPDGVITGGKPSIELPFHSLIYSLRPDVNAVLHVHSPYLVTYSLFNQAPPTQAYPLARIRCGKIGLSAYDIPGSIELGKKIAEFISNGYDSVMMENHGVVIVAPTMKEAYEKLELLERCGESAVKARVLGGITAPITDDINYYDFKTQPYSGEKADEIKIFAARCAAHKYFADKDGIIALRTRKGIAVNAEGINSDLKPSDVALLDNNDGSVLGRLINAVFSAGGDNINAVFAACIPSVMAYSVTHTRLDSRTIPESYINMRDVVRCSLSDVIRSPEKIAVSLSEKNPILIVDNGFVLTVGINAVKAFDRLEVTAVTANSLINSAPLGTPATICDEEIDRINRAFNLPL